MAEILDLISETSFVDKMNQSNALLAALAGNSGNAVMKSWKDVQRIVRLGLASKILYVGDRLVTNKNEKTLTFDILDFDKHTPKNKTLKNSLALGLHNIYTYGTIPFSAPQLMYYTENGLPAGNYKFTLDHANYHSDTQYDGTYMFTLTKAIPADGGFRHTNIGKALTLRVMSSVITSLPTAQDLSVMPLRATLQ